MLVATDVRYTGDGTARAVALGFDRWTSPKPTEHWVAHVDGVAEYEPGAFYRRELPCLLQVLGLLPEVPSVVIVDGHTWLSAGRPGLGHYLWGALDRAIPVVGVAKRAFHEGTALPVVRGESTAPLWVSAVGMTDEQAAAHVRAMHGPYRLPTLLKRVDALSRAT